MRFAKIILSLVIAMLIGTATFGAAGGAAAVLLSLIPKGVPTGALCADLIPEVWTKEFVKSFNHADTGTFLEGISDYSRFVKDGNIIHLIDFDLDPEVLVNNTQYPIPVQEMNNADIVLTLDKLQTKATPVTDDVVYDIKAELMPHVIEEHRVAISEYRLDKAIFNFAAEANADATPVIATTGVDFDSEAVKTDGTRLRLTRADVIKLKTAFDKMGVPIAGRRLVLCPDHVADLLVGDLAFAQQYQNHTTGAIAKMYGFEIYEFVANPVYTANGSRKAYGVAAEQGEYQASVAFHVSRVGKATGERKQYLSRAETDPLYQRNLYNVREYFLAMPKKKEALGVIYSGTAQS
ncbi:MAG: hypothetical protein IJX68_02045 [Rikenellaceae bacterium]|nr:hypothetical protein [Rikenellaceae bacterium]